MTRSIGLLMVIGLVVGAAPAPDTYTIKLKESSTGDIVEVDEVSTEQMHIKVLDAANKVLADKTETKVKSSAFRETILEKPDPKKRPTRLRREYTRAEVKIDDKTRTLPYQGKSVLIEKGKDGKYRFEIENGKELTGADAEYLHNEFNKDKAGDGELQKLLVPNKPVAVGDTWKIDPAPLVKELAGGENKMGVDTAKATATGKLLEISQKGGAQFGKMDYTLNLPLTEFIEGGQKIPLQAGAAITITFTAELCIDGSLQTGSIKGLVNLSAIAQIPQGKLILSSKVNAHEQRKEVSRK